MMECTHTSKETKMTMIKCPSCEGDVSPKAFDCPACGHPLRKPRRGPFGLVMKWALILFNVAMVAWIAAYFNELGEIASTTTDDAEMTGLGIGGAIGTGMILTVWVLGDIILGLIVLLTRPRK